MFIANVCDLKSSARSYFLGAAAKPALDYDINTRDGHCTQRETDFESTFSIVVALDQRRFRTDSDGTYTGKRINE